MPRDEQETYIQRLAKLGYCWQFITLAGLHQSALMADTFSKAYAKQGMRAYGEIIQEPEAENKVDVLTHQVDAIVHIEVIGGEEIVVFEDRLEARTAHDLFFERSDLAVQIFR